MKYAVVDVETTVFQKGHPFANRNKLCLVGIRIGETNHFFKIEYDEEPYGPALLAIAKLLKSVDVVVGFNIKFDLNWLARYGCVLPHSCRVFDCQLAEFILTNQLHPYPSLGNCVTKYSLGIKSSHIHDCYWSRGLDTTEIPYEELETYLRGDLELTDDLYTTLVQLVQKQSIMPLLLLHNQDLRVLQEMETNGIALNWGLLFETAERTQEELNATNLSIREYVPEHFRAAFNTASNDHVSLLLYGGSLVTKVSTPYQHSYKSGPKAGTTEPRLRWNEVRVEFPRLVAPLDGSALAKEGFWSTSADILRQLPKPKKLITLLLRQAELSKLLDTYLVGFPEKAKEMDWTDGCIHSTLNQCVAITGRLSSSKPNQQNLPEIMSGFITTRYAE